MNKKVNWYKERKAILHPFEREILTQYPKTPKGSGIYVLTRKENGEDKAYIGQSIHVLQRMAEHMVDFKSHIDRSLKIYGLKTILNPKGWHLESFEYNTDKLDVMETVYVAEYIAKGYKVYNKTSGGQGLGKRQISEYKERKGYQQGLKNGYKKAQKYVANLFKRNLIFTINGKDGVNKQKAKEKFEKFLKGE